MQVIGVPEALALLSAFVLASATVVTRYGLQHLPPRAGAAISIPTAAVLIGAVSVGFLDLTAFHPKAAVIFLAVGLFFPAFATLLVFESNARVGPSLTGALSSVVPLFALAGAWIFLGEVPTPMAALGALIVVVGVSRLSAGASGGHKQWLGWLALLPLTVAAIRGVAQTSLKLGFQYWPDPFVALAASYAVSALVVRTVHAFTPASKRAKPSWRGSAWFMAVGLLNATAIFAMYAALTEGSVVVVSALVATFPLFIVILERLLFPTTGTKASTAAIAFTVAGVIMIIASHS